jgi:hypothetical protein
VMELELIGIDETTGQASHLPIFSMPPNPIPGPLPSTLWWPLPAHCRYRFCLGTRIRKARACTLGASTSAGRAIKGHGRCNPMPLLISRAAGRVSFFTKEETSSRASGGPRIRRVFLSASFELELCRSFNAFSSHLW